MKNISMSYDEYDNLLDAIDNLKLQDDYEFPTLDEAQEMITNMAGVVALITAAEKTEDKEYAKALNDLIKENVEFTQDTFETAEEIVFKGQKERLKKITEKITQMDFQIPNFCPSKTEIDEIAKKDLAKDNGALGFLIWVSMLGGKDGASQQVKDISAYTKKVLERAFKLM